MNETPFDSIQIFEPSLEDIYKVMHVLNREWKRQGSDSFMLNKSKLSSTGLTLRELNKTFDKLDQKYGVITLAKTPYDEGNNEDDYYDMNAEQILEADGLPVSSPILEYVTNILSYGVIIESDFKTFYVRLKNADRSKNILEPVNQLPKSAKIRYDTGSSILMYGGDSLKMNGLIRSTICAEVFSHRKETVYYGDIADKIDPTKDLSKSIYDSIRGINNEIEKNFGLKKVLETGRERVNISKKYL